jgi:hypothetical protein
MTSQGSCYYQHLLLTVVRTKKRRRGVTAEPQLPIGGFVELSEDDLLKLDSKQMEVYIKNFTASRNVTPVHLKDLKKVRR